MRSVIYRSLWRQVLRPLAVRLTADCVYTVRHGVAKGLKRKGGVGFVYRRLLPEEKFLMGLRFSGQTVYDVGANEGSFTMFFAMAVGENGHVVAFEPHPKNCSRIVENLGLNRISNVKLRPIGLGDKKGSSLLVFHDADLARGSAVKEIGEKFLEERGARTIRIQIDTLDNQIEDLPPPDFVKIDVEGMEFHVLCGMENTIRDHKPRLLIEIHGTGHGEASKIENGQQVINFLRGEGYSVYHIENGKMTTVFRTKFAREDHFYCAAQP